MTTNQFAKQLRSESYDVKIIKPGLIAANNGRWFYRFEQTSQGWQKFCLGPMQRRR